jgi:hypothetical protein
MPLLFIACASLAFWTNVHTLASVCVDTYRQLSMLTACFVVREMFTVLPAFSVGETSTITGRFLCRANNVKLKMNVGWSTSVSWGRTTLFIPYRFRTCNWSSRMTWSVLSVLFRSKFGGIVELLMHLGLVPKFRVGGLYFTPSWQESNPPWPSLCLVTMDNRHNLATFVRGPSQVQDNRCTVDCGCWIGNRSRGFRAPFILEPLVILGERPWEQLGASYVLHEAWRKMWLSSVQQRCEILALHFMWL